MNRPVRTRYQAGPALASAALTVQLTLAATLLVDPPPQPVEELTAWGRAFYLPEHDVPIYLAGVVLGTALGVLLVRTWRRRLDRPATTEQFMRRCLGLQIVAAAAGTALFLNRFFAARPFVLQGDGVPAGLVAAFAAIGLLTIAPAMAGWAGFRLGRRPAAGGPEP
ncbi:MAG TPA: hypothetical protein VHL54_12345, partial [Actinomycetota bacterium]|nr:hypothetical protein [Actinomycetota bacterium]